MKDRAPSVGIGPPFGMSVVVDECLLLGAIDVRERLFEEGLVGREGDPCKLKFSMKALV